jgi:hypothetical protein
MFLYISIDDLVNCELIDMSSSEDDSEPHVQGGNSVSKLADFFNKQFSGGDERRKTTTTTDYNISEVKLSI